MNPAQASQVDCSFGNNRFLQMLLIGYAILWLVTAVAPSSRQDWLLENLLVFITLTVLVVTYRRFQFSNVSYALIALFLALHAVGAHYTYSEMPLGNWLRDALFLARNHYDRVVHFAFGLLIAFPLREVLTRAARVRHGWSYAVTINVVMAWSALYELLEALVAYVVSPEVGAAYTGTQGDVWDAQKDTALAMTGALICMAVTAALERKVRGINDTSETRSSDVSTGVRQGPPARDEMAGLFESTSTRRIEYEPDHGEDRKARSG